MSDIKAVIYFYSKNEADTELIKEKLNTCCSDLEHLPHEEISYKLYEDGIEIKN